MSVASFFLLEYFPPTCLPLTSAIPSPQPSPHLSHPLTSAIPSSQPSPHLSQPLTLAMPSPQPPPHLSHSLTSDIPSPQLPLHLSYPLTSATLSSLPFLFSSVILITSAICGGSESMVSWAYMTYSYGVE